MAASLTDLMKGKPKHIKFTPEAKVAFANLKWLFTNAPILKLPDPLKQFIVVDASEVG